MIKFSLPFLSFLFINLIFLSGCGVFQKSELSKDADGDGISEYKRILKLYTRSDSRYSGFYQSYELTGTLLTREVNRLILQKKAVYHQWDAKTLSSEREKSLEKMTNQTSFFFSLYTPERDYNDLNKANSIWRVYLEMGGRRYQGKVTKRNDKPVDLTTLFAYHTRWSVPYQVDFEIPTETAERNPIRISFASSLGTSNFDFLPELEQ